MNLVYIFIGGGLGSVARYGLGNLSLKWFSGNFPLGTFLSNLIACIILGVLVYTLNARTLQADWVKPLLVVGFCGGFSTFSTFSNDTVQLFSNGNASIAILNIVLSLSTCIAAIYFLKSMSN